VNPAIVILAVLIGVLLLRHTSLSTRSGASEVILPNQINTGRAPTVIQQEQQEGKEGQAVANAANAIPVVGPAISQGLKALFGFLLGASAKRAKMAIAENTAVNKAVSWFDQGVKEVVDSANNGQLSANEALQYCDLLWTGWWDQTAPSIQVGRNGCNSGSSCTAVTMGCPGRNIGAACCVGCDEIRQSINNLRAMFSAGRGSARIYQVVANAKYGTMGRAGYTVSYRPPNPVTNLLSFL
jgi:hypothetical protein